MRKEEEEDLNKFNYNGDISVGKGCTNNLPFLLILYDSAAYKLLLVRLWPDI